MGHQQQSWGEGRNTHTDTTTTTKGQSVRTGTYVRTYASTTWMDRQPRGGGVVVVRVVHTDIIHRRHGRTHTHTHTHTHATHTHSPSIAIAPSLPSFLPSFLPPSLPRF
eukprot:GHVU01059331.1.p1 GENE.GHVU01059331.1~~GHVU01059331.1.p1  ORF type:complete len:109 (-),score=12.30 GHVU01059331.1:32-358(-)